MYDKTSQVNLSVLGAELATTMPEVQAHAVQQAAAEAIEAQGKDSSGAVFDPAIHATGPDGRGMLNASGVFAKKRGRKAGQASPAAEKTLGSAQKPAPAGVSGESRIGGVVDKAQLAAQATSQAQCRAAGIAAAEMLFAVGQVLGGEEWAPAKNASLGTDERAMMHSAMAEYFVAKGVSDIPPGAALSFCIIAYAAPRFAMPKTQSRWQAAKSFVATWWINRKLRKAGLEQRVAVPAEKA